MQFTNYHAKYFAHELTKRHSSDSIEKLASALADAQVDLNPHQVEAALFAFKNPFSKGAILADEVGLGKTIEAGLLLSQKWAERKRKLLVLVPANLRKQWGQELAEKFHLPSTILENKSFNDYIRQGKLNPFDQDAIVLCSYQFARSKEPYICQMGWDLVVIDEAHRLRNVYKTSSKIANAIKQAIAPFPKVLLTATPLQNSLLELYGLVSIIDDYSFGDLKSYRARYARLGDDTFAELRERLKPLCKRTLRKQVLEYVKYTNRHALVQEFVPTPDEQKLYELVSEYLQKPTLYALPASQRQLITLILRKLLASSTYAISGTLDGLVQRLEAAAASAESVDNPPEDLADNWEDVDELEDEWGDDENDDGTADKARLTPQQLAELKAEMAQLREFYELAKSIVKNSKGEVLLTALRKGFDASAQAQREKGAATLQQKAVIFTESRRTQEYLFRILEEAGFAGKVILFNGSNADAKSKEIYRAWLEKHKGTDRISNSPTADMRAALTECFRDEASIMIATEAAAEGINLQFCNLVVNYDLPWNPQRIEQRIGRCHRYGQIFDVVVVNFINRKNAADQRVYELLAQKFQLFDGVFGASDEILGAVESGVDFEKRIAAIYQKCRTQEQIQFEFDQLQKDLEAEISANQQDAREKLLNHFDQEVIDKVRMDSRAYLDRFNTRLWLLTRFLLNDYAHFAENEYSFTLHRNPFVGEKINRGPYRMGKDVEDVNTYRVGHPLAQRLLEQACAIETPARELTFDYRQSKKNIAVLDELTGKSGWLLCSRFTIQALEVEDHLILTGMTESGELLDDLQCKRLFDLSATAGEGVDVPDEVRAQLDDQQTRQQNVLLENLMSRNNRWFEVEIDKLDRWADDRRASLKADLDGLDVAIREARKAARLAPNLPEKLNHQQNVRKLEAKHAEVWRNYDAASRELDSQKETLLDDIGQRLKQATELEPLFVVHWKVQ